ncbi:MAG TPA: hypothetical protein PLH06_13945, partial [Candidatus Hydrogenedentes bacterium]|nr:hypothetical protein [Candidatus Hydrogenedentota bacterium]
SDAKTILDALSKLEAAMVLPRPLDPAVTGLDTPVFTATVQCAGDTIPGEALIGPVRVGNPSVEDPQRRYADMAGRQGQFLVSQELLETVRTAVKGLRPPAENQENNTQGAKTGENGGT